ncbi:MAG TPA: hypothetical protein VE684_15145, partial [Crenalkalicoccus sp.]|nr:hypothetical protein [Crenalkalicoccus sp.]
MTTGLEMPSTLRAAPRTEGAAATARVVERAIVLLLLGALLAGVALVLAPFATAILFGAILAVATWPLRALFLRAGLGGGAAAVLMTLAALALFGLPAILAAPRLAAGVAEGVADLQALLASMAGEPPGWVARLPLAG